MYKRIIPLVLPLLICVNAYAQNKVNFEYTLSDTTVIKSLYNTLSLIDTRADTGSFGYVQTGAFNRIGKVASQNPFGDEVKRIFGSLIKADAANGQLLLHLRQLSFAEATGAFGEYGYCTIQVEIYAKNGMGYQKVNSLDTLIRLRSSLDVTNAILRSGSRQLTTFIQTSLLLPPANNARTYTYYDITHIDSIEKTVIPLYSNKTYTNGLYLTYQSFKNQVPDKQGITVENDYVYPGYVKAPDEKGKLKDVKLKKTYAIVYKGLPYIVNEFGFYPLSKVSNEFIFAGKAKTPPSTASLIVVSAMFGTVGTLMASSVDEGTFEMKIDHQNGSIIKLKEIPQPKVESKGDSWD
jgi:hypothetical protein